MIQLHKNRQLIQQANAAPLSKDARYHLTLAIFNDLVTGVFSMGECKDAETEWFIEGSCGGHDFFISAWTWESVATDVLDETYVQKASQRP